MKPSEFFTNTETLAQIETLIVNTRAALEELELLHNAVQCLSNGVCDDNDDTSTALSAVQFHGGNAEARMPILEDLVDAIVDMQNVEGVDTFQKMMDVIDIPAEE